MATIRVRSALGVSTKAPGGHRPRHVVTDRQPRHVLHTPLVHELRVLEVGRHDGVLPSVQSSAKPEALEGIIDCFHNALGAYAEPAAMSEPTDGYLALLCRRRTTNRAELM